MKNIALPQPEWLTRSAIYQINIRTFSEEGTIKSVTKELSFIKSLGFNIVYLCPIFCADDSSDKNNWSERQLKSGTENPKNPYRMNDYFSIDTEYGTMEDLKELVCEAHKLDMKVLLDLVYAHIGPNAPIIKRFPDFVQQTESGKTINTVWNFPMLDYRNNGLREYMYCNMVFYISVIDIDGFRCDIGDDVPIDFWSEARRRIKSVKPDAVLINEGKTYQNLAVAFDGMYFWKWHNSLYDVFINKKNPSLLQITDNEAKSKMPFDGMLLRDMDNHDTVTDWPERVENTIGHNGMEEILVINYIIDGIPMVYCGNELACGAKLSMFANRFHMGAFETSKRDKTNEFSLQRQNIIKKLNLFKFENDVLRYGKTNYINNSDNERCFSFKRTYGNKNIMFIGNVTTDEYNVKTDDEIPKNAEIILSNGLKHHSENEFSFDKYGYAVISY